jgi:hypothetical protein
MAEKIGRIDATTQQTKEEVSEIRAELRDHIEKDVPASQWATKKFLIALAFLATIVTPILVDKIFERAEHRGYVKIWLPREEFYTNYRIGPDGRVYEYKNASYSSSDIPP